MIVDSAALRVGGASSRQQGSINDALGGVAERIRRSKGCLCRREGFAIGHAVQVLDRRIRDVNVRIPDRNAGERLTAVPDLRHGFEDGSVDDPSRVAELVEGSKDGLEGSRLVGFLHVKRLFDGFGDAHERSFSKVSV